MGVLLSVSYLLVTFVTIKLRKLMTVHGIDAYIVSNFWRALFAMCIAWFIVPPSSRYVVGLGMVLVYHGTRKSCTWDPAKPQDESLLNPTQMLIDIVKMNP